MSEYDAYPASHMSINRDVDFDRRRLIEDSKRLFSGDTDNFEVLRLSADGKVPYICSR
jgi:hypothetical protein